MNTKNQKKGGRGGKEKNIGGENAQRTHWAISGHNIISTKTKSLYKSVTIYCRGEID